MKLLYVNKLTYVPAFSPRPPVKTTPIPIPYYIRITTNRKVCTNIVDSENLTSNNWRPNQNCPNTSVTIFTICFPAARTVSIVGLILLVSPCQGYLGWNPWTLEPVIIATSTLWNISIYNYYYCKVKCRTKKEVIIINTQTIKILPLINYILAM